MLFNPRDVLLTAFLIATLPPDKGKAFGACNRTACLARPATWVNPASDEHYCPDCAAKINRSMQERAPYAPQFVPIDESPAS